MKLIVISLRLLNESYSTDLWFYHFIGQFKYDMPRNVDWVGKMPSH